MKIPSNEREYIGDILEEAINRRELGVTIEVTIGSPKDILVTIEIRNPKGTVHVHGHNFTEVRNALGDWMYKYHDELEDML